MPKPIYFYSLKSLHLLLIAQTQLNVFFINLCKLFLCLFNKSLKKKLIAQIKIELEFLKKDFSRQTIFCRQHFSDKIRFFKLTNNGFI